MDNLKNVNYVFVWVFKGGQTGYTSGVFSTKEKAEEWITAHQLSGTLAAYPLDVGVYDWAVQNGYFKPKDEFHRTAQWIGGFTTASQQVYIYENGKSLFR